MRAWIAFLVILLIGCNHVEVDNMDALMIISQENFRDEELIEPKDVLESNGINVEVASITKDTAKGMLGLEYEPDLSVKEADIDQYDIIIIVGGSGSPELGNHQEVISLLQRAKEEDKYIAAICLGPTVLAKAGILENRNATVYSSGKQDIEKYGANFVDKSIIVDRNIITANGPQAAREFGRKIVEIMYS